MDGTDFSFKGCECLKNLAIVEIEIFANRSYDIHITMLPLRKEASE